MYFLFKIDMINIDQLSNYTKLSKSTIRYYEKLGLIQSFRNPENNYRLYKENAISELLCIKTLKNLNFSLKEIKEIISYFRNEDTPQENIYSIFYNKLSEIERDIQNLINKKINILELLKICQSNSCKCNIKEKIYIPSKY
ncbi:MAG: MerR family transcriptional regulator [Leptospiraceae bacterium]|nr:MAG: MerR family transcriptional regulator [Leptospiraceae bacterium]